MNIDKREVLRYLGYKGQTIEKHMDNIICDCIGEANKLIQKNFLYNIFPIIKRENYLELKGTNVILEGFDIVKHLSSAEDCAIIVATVGSMVEKRIMYYEKTNLTKASIIDACATVAVEKLCDEIEEGIRKIARDKNLFLSYRYSPGYGDFNISIQKDILNIMGAYRIGVTCTEDYILMPRKSVTALMGIGSKNFAKSNGCIQCSNYKQCKYRKDEGCCEY